MRKMGDINEILYFFVAIANESEYNMPIIKKSSLYNLILYDLKVRISTQNSVINSSDLCI